MHLTTGRGARVAALGLALLAFAGCGDDDPAPPVVPTNQPPTVNAGADASVTAGESVALAATVTDAEGDAVTHAWSLVSAPAGTAATLAADAPLSTTLQTDVEGTYVVRLTATDATSSAFDERVITAQSSFTGGTVSGTEATAGAELTALAARVDAVLGYMAAKGLNTINADAVMKRLSGKDTKAADTMMVIDVRSALDFAKGHIPGAVNLPLAELPKALLGNPGLLPVDTVKDIVIASYNGGDGNMANLIVNLVLAPNPLPSTLPTTLTWSSSRSMFGGMPSWSFDRELSPTRFDDDLGVRRVENGPTTPTATAGVAQGAFPAFTAFSSSTDGVTKKLLVRARDFLGIAQAQGEVWVDFVKYKQLAEDADAGNDPQVVSARGAADYAKGHVAGAINIPWASAAKSASFQNVKPSGKAFVYCYTGHTGAIATMALGLLGYPARNLLYGLNGWTLDGAVASGQLRRFDVAKAWDFPLHDTGGGVASLAAYAPPAAGCKTCHTELTALYANYNYTEPPAPGVVSEGEG